MCGISGVVNLDHRHIGNLGSYIEQAAICGQLRGWDSTGMFQVNKKGGFELHKLPVQGEHFVASKNVQKRIGRTGNMLATILHNRAATKGDVTQENAHPFMHPAPGKIKDGGKAIVGVHNGTIYGPTPYKWKDKEFEVDSDYLYYRIFDQGAEKALSDVNGSFALVWYENTGALCIASNHERPFYWGYIKDRNAMLLASEDRMMYWLAGRNGIELEKIVAPDKNKIYKFDLHSGSELRKFETVDIPQKPPYVATAWSNARDFRGARQDNTQSQTPVGTASSSDKQSIDQFMTKNKIGRHDTVPFSPLGATQEGARTVEGFIETHDHELLDARMLDTNPMVVRSMQGCDYAMVQIKGVIRNEAKNRFEVVVGHPFSVVSGEDNLEKEPEIAKQSGEFSDLDNLIPSGMVMGPGHKPITQHTFMRLLENGGCVRCGDDSMFPEDADKMEWVGNKPVCPRCVAHNKAGSKIRRESRDLMVANQ